MRKNLLALSIAAMVGGLSGVANAATGLTSDGALDLVSFDPTVVEADPRNGVVGPVDVSVPPQDSGIAALPTGGAATRLVNSVAGIGHILVVPYFTSQGANHSLLNIVNTDTVNGKAVKLRYRGAANSDDLFDITVYLSPGDVWTADVSVDADGFSRLETSDNSCTLPSRQEIKDAFNGRFKVDRVAGEKAETREGYIEILNTADIPPTRPGLDINGVALGANPLFAAIKHVNGVAPCTKAVMDQQENVLVPVPFNANSPRVRGYSWPTGGLMANWAIVDMSKTASFSGEAIAVRAETAGNVNGAGRLVWAPQTSTLVSYANALQLTADPLFRNNVVKAQSVDFPDLSTPYTAAALPVNPLVNTPIVRSQVDPLAQARRLSNALAVTNVINEYLTNPSVGFETDWVFSMPTRRYAVAVNYAANRLEWNDINLTRNGGDSTVTPNLNAPAALQNGYFSAANTDYVNRRACVYTASMLGFDREENSRTSFQISPSPAYRLCGETSVLAFNKTTAQTSLLGAALARENVDTKMLEGWLTIRTPGLTGAGLPVTGFAAVKANGNIGGTWAHRTLRP